MALSTSTTPSIVEMVGLDQGFFVFFGGASVAAGTEFTRGGGEGGGG